MIWVTKIYLIEFFFSFCLLLLELPYQLKDRREMKRKITAMNWNIFFMEENLFLWRNFQICSLSKKIKEMTAVNCFGWKDLPLWVFCQFLHSSSFQPGASFPNSRQERNKKINISFNENILLQKILLMKLMLIIKLFSSNCTLEDTKKVSCFDILWAISVKLFH